VTEGDGGKLTGKVRELLLGGGMWTADRGAMGTADWKVRETAVWWGMGPADWELWGMLIGEEWRKVIGEVIEKRWCRDMGNCWCGSKWGWWLESYRGMLGLAGSFKDDKWRVWQQNINDWTQVMARPPQMLIPETVKSISDRHKRPAVHIQPTLQNLPHNLYTHFSTPQCPTLCNPPHPDSVWYCHHSVF